ncbi:MAG TPA: RDD family protein [Polyangia bacterium]|jgi:uncharacterized RDD family membrane protein YckC
MSGQNPYEPPKAELSHQADPGQLDELPTAGLGARFLNFIIDSIISRVVIIVVVGGVVRGIGPSESGPALAIILALVAFAGYYVVLEAAFGWTVGKLITGTRVVRFDGKKPNVPQILGRTFARFIPFEPFSLLFGSSNQGWHDSMSGTRVVRVRR